MRRQHHLGPLSRPDLVGAEVLAYAVIEDLRRRAREGAETGIA